MSNHHNNLRGLAILSFLLFAGLSVLQVAVAAGDGPDSSVKSLQQQVNEALETAGVAESKLRDAISAAVAQEIESELLGDQFSCAHYDYKVVWQSDDSENQGRGWNVSVQNNGGGRNRKAHQWKIEIAERPPVNEDYAALLAAEYQYCVSSGKAERFPDSERLQKLAAWDEQKYHDARAKAFPGSPAVQQDVDTGMVSRVAAPQSEQVGLTGETEADSILVAPGAVGVQAITTELVSPEVHADVPEVHLSSADGSVDAALPEQRVVTFYLTIPGSSLMID